MLNDHLLSANVPAPTELHALPFHPQVDLALLHEPCTRHEPFNFTPMGINAISSGSPHVRPMGRTCGEPNEIKKNTHPKTFTLPSVTRRP